MKSSPIPLAKNLHAILDSSNCLSEEYELKEPEVREEMREELVQEILALIQTVCSSVISKDDRRTYNIDSPKDYINYLRNELRASQRQTLKDIISGKIKI